MIYPTLKLRVWSLKQEPRPLFINLFCSIYVTFFQISDQIYSLYFLKLLGSFWLFYKWPILKTIINQQYSNNIYQMNKWVPYF